MGEVIHRVDAPGLAGVMVFGMANAVEQRVAHPNIRRSHVDLRAQGAGSVGEFARLHPLEQIEALFNRAVAERAVFSGAVWSPAVAVRTFGSQIADISGSRFYKLHGILVKLLEI